MPSFIATSENAVRLHALVDGLAHSADFSDVS